MKSDKSYIIPVNFSWTGGFSGQYYFINGYFIYNNNNLYHYALTKSSGGFNNEPFAILHLDIASKNFPFSKSFAYNNTNGSKKFKSSESTSITNNEAQELKLWGIGLGFLIAKEGISYLWTNLKEKLKNSESYDTSPSFSSDGSSFTERKNKKCFDKAKLDYPKYTIKQIQSDKTLIGTKYIRIDFSSSGQDYSGKLYYNESEKEYYIDTGGIFGGNLYDKNFEKLIYPLFVFKKCGAVSR